MITRHIAFNTIAALFISATVHAQTAAPQNAAPQIDKQAEAREVYRNARKAENEGDFDKACPMYETALALVPDYQKAAVAVAKCYEKAGKYLTAVNRYLRAQEVAAIQSVQNPELLDIISSGMASATSRISYVTIYVPGSVGSIEGVSVTLNGKVIDSTTYGTKIPLDRGNYVIVTAAPRRISSKIEFEVKGDAQDFQRTLVPLEIKPEDSKADEPKSPNSSTSDQPTPRPVTKPKKEKSKHPPKVPTPPPRVAIDDAGSSSVKQRNENPLPLNPPPNPKNSSSTAGGVALVLIGAGFLTFASLTAKVAVDRHDAGYEYTSYAGGSVAGFIIGATSFLAGVAIASSSPSIPQKQSALVLHSPKLLIGPGQVTFQARW